jgi:hypothetical protein
VKTIKLAFPWTRWSRITRTVPALVFGQWAAHESRSTDFTGWAVTHVPSGRSASQYFGGGLTKPDAVAIARRIAKFGDSFDGDTPTIASRCQIEAVFAEVLTGMWT